MDGSIHAILPRLSVYMGFVQVSYFFVFALWLCTIIKATGWTRNEHLLVAGNNGPNGSASITVTTRINKPTKQFNFSDHIISPACGSDPSRCRQLLVANFTNSKQQIVLVPLNSSIGIMEFSYEDEEFTHRTTHAVNFIAPSISRCTPITILQHRRTFSTVCFLERRLYTCVINLNTTNITQSFAPCRSSSSLLLETNRSINASLVSNFVFVDLHPGKFIFAYRTKIYDVNPDTGVFKRYKYGVEGAVNGSCQHLALVGTQLINAYCQDNETDTNIDVYYDIPDDYWIKTNANITYVCPSVTSVSNVTTFLGDSYVRHTSQNATRNVTVVVNITATDVYDGVCFGTEDNETFVFLDRFRGMFVVNISARCEKHISLPDQLCTNNSQCELLPVYDDQYIVLQGRDTTGVSSTVIVLDARNNFSPIITTSLAESSLITVISFPLIMSATTSTPFTMNETTSAPFTMNETTSAPFTMNETTTTPSLGPPDREKSRHEITVGIPVIVLSVTVTPVAIVAIVLFIFYQTKKRLPCQNADNRELNIIPMSPSDSVPTCTQFQATGDEHGPAQDNIKEQELLLQDYQSTDLSTALTEATNTDSSPSTSSQVPSTNDSNSISTNDNSPTGHGTDGPRERYQDSDASIESNESTPTPNNDDHFNRNPITSDSIHQATNLSDDKSAMVTGHGK